MAIGRTVSCGFLAALMCWGACHTAAAQASYEIGRSRNGTLVYEGVLSRAGAQQVAQALKPMDTFAIFSPGGDLAAGISIAEAINNISGKGRVSRMCYAECAASMILLLDDITVTYGATVLFTKRSLRLIGNDSANKLISCIPSDISDSQYVWASPNVIAEIGLINVRFEWVVEESARDSYERFAGSDIHWLDRCNHSA